MKGKSQLHLPGGKILKIRLEHDDFINKVEISGDLIITPPEAVHEMEKCLIDVEVESDESGISNLIEDTLIYHHATMEGASPRDIARAVKNAIGNL
jgi:hypothetical protein